MLTQGFPGGSMVKNLPTNVGDLGLILGQEDALDKEMETHSSTLPLGNPMDRGDWWATVHDCRVRHNLVTTLPPPPPPVLTQWHLFSLPNPSGTLLGSIE